MSRRLNLKHSHAKPSPSSPKSTTLTQDYKLNALCHRHLVALAKLLHALAQRWNPSAIGRCYEVGLFVTNITEFFGLWRQYITECNGGCVFSVWLLK